METDNNQDLENAGIPTPKQFRTKFQEIFESETNFGSSRAARLELLESVADIIKEYLNHDCSIVYLHGKLKEAGYTGSRKELSEWLFSKDMRTKREISKKVGEKAEKSENDSDKDIEYGEVSASPTAPTPEAATTTPDNKNASSVQNADQAVSEENQKITNHPDMSKPDFAPNPGKTKIVYSGTVNPNQVKN